MRFRVWPMLLLVAGSVRAQSLVISVVAADSQPVPYASISVNNTPWRVADAKGQMTVVLGRAGNVNVSVRRIGFAPRTSSVAIRDSVTTTTVSLTATTQSLGTVTVTGRQALGPVEAFFRRASEQEKWGGSVAFLTPEEIEARRPGRPSDLFRGLKGIDVKQNRDGMMVLTTNQGTCQVPVLVDGVQVLKMKKAPMTRAANGVVGGDGPSESIDKFFSATEIQAVEVYSRGGRVPIELQVGDMGCGLIAIWTGSRE